MHTDTQFVAIGDIVIDAFIRIADAHTETIPGTDNVELCLRFGDKVPYESVTVVPAVGNSPNAAVAAARLGLRTALVTDIGDDHHGAMCTDQLKKEAIALDFVKTHEKMVTNYHYVLWYKDDRTILIKHQPYPRQLPDLGTPPFVYVSSIGQDSEAYHDEIVRYAVAHPDVKIAFQPGTFQIAMDHARLQSLYEHTYILFVNKDEAQRLLGVEEHDVKKLLEGLHSWGPRVVVVTNGPDGAYAYDGTNYFHVPMYPDQKPPFDRTGAGDAFSSTVTVALALGKPLEEALLWGPVNSMSVVQYTGAQEGLLTREKLEAYLAEAPANYTVEKI